MKSIVTKAQIVLFVGVLALLAGCRKEFDTPPIRTIPVGNLLTISQLRDMYTGENHKFSGDTSVYCLVTADEASGNLYKSVFISDGTGGIEVRLMNSGGLYEGDSIRIYLRDVTLGDYNGMLQLDSVDVDLNVVKVATGKPVYPVKINLTDVNTLVQGQLVQLDDVQFNTKDLGKTYADAVGELSQNRMLEDCNGNQLIVRTSGFSTFAGDTVSALKGKFVGVVGEFSGDIQLIIRKLSDIDFQSERCDPIHSKDFDDFNLNSGGWTVQVPVGTASWVLGSYGGASYAEISNYAGGNHASEAWLISPSLDLSAFTTVGLKFRSACDFNGPAIEIWISENYNGTAAPASATWTKIQGAALSAGDFNWVSSGYLNISPWTSSNVHFAFKYLGTDTDGKRWEIDDIVVREL